MSSDTKDLAVPPAESFRNSIIFRALMGYPLDAPTPPTLSADAIAASVVEKIRADLEARIKTSLGRMIRVINHEAAAASARGESEYANWITSNHLNRLASGEKDILLKLRSSKWAEGCMRRWLSFVEDRHANPAASLVPVDCGKRPSPLDLFGVSDEDLEEWLPVGLRDEYRERESRYRQADHSNGQDAAPDFLNIAVNVAERTVSRGGKGPVGFAASDKPWRLFRSLLAARADGKTQAELMRDVFGINARTDSALRQHKGVANEILAVIGIEITSHQALARGTWVLSALTA